jgi:hypothetical protein
VRERKTIQQRSMLLYTVVWTKNNEKFVFRDRKQKNELFSIAKNGTLTLLKAFTTKAQVSMLSFIRLRVNALRLFQLIIDQRTRFSKSY